MSAHENPWPTAYGHGDRLSAQEREGTVFVRGDPVHHRPGEPRPESTARRGTKILSKPTGKKEAELFLLADIDDFLHRRYQRIDKKLPDVRRIELSN